LNKTLSWSFRAAFFFILLILVSCRSPVSSPTPSATETLSVAVESEKAGPQIVQQEPLEGQRLDLSPVIQIVFDRDMDQTRTGGAWTLLGPDEEPVPGKINWRDPRTFEFTPNSKLKPSVLYRATFSTKATALDGTSPQVDLQLEFKTVEALAVGQVFPASDAEDIDGKTNITVIFNRPIVPVAIKEEQTGLPQPIELSPQTAGHGEWVNSSVYVFQPDQPLVSGVRYTVRVGAGLKDTTGNALDKSFIWQFSTSPAIIDNFALKNGPQNPGEVIENVLLDQSFIITFHQPMDSKSVEKAVTLVNRETGKPFPIRLRWNKDFTMLTIEPAGRYQIASFYRLTVDEAARAEDGGTLKEGLDIKFSTVPLPRIVKVSPAPNSVAKEYNSSITIEFASPMRFESMKSRVLISPNPKGGAQPYYNTYSRRLYVYGLEPATEYVVRILPGMTDIYGNGIKNDYSFTFKTGDMRSYARLVLPWTPLVYRAKGPQEVYFEHTNLDSATVSLYPLAFDEFSRMLKGDLATTDFSPQVQPIREWTPDTQALRNQVNRTKFKLEDPKGNTLEPGYYFIGIQGKPLDYKSRFYQGFLFIVATDNVTFKATSTEGLAWVVDLESGQPQTNVPVTFYDKDFHEVGSASTDQNGLAYLDGLGSPRYARAEGSNHLAFAAMDWGSGVSAGDFGLYENYYGATNGPFVYLYTERPIYRPGQDVYFKGIVRQNDDLHYSLPTQTQAYVTIEGSGEKVYGEYLPISESGSFSGTFKIADDAALGTYGISVRYSPSGDPFGYLSFRVAEYRKPEFQVITAPDKANVLVGDKVQFNLDASYYSGGSVGNGEVGWFLEAAPYYFVPAAKYSQFSFMEWDRDMYWSPQKAGTKGTLAEGQSVTDENGHLAVAQAVNLGENKVSQQVSFKANVTDVAGNLVSGSTSVVVHQSQVYAGIRSLSYVGKQGQEQPFEVVVLDWDSKPVSGQSVTVRFVERRWYSVQQQDKQGQLRWVTSVKEIPAGQKNVVTGEDGVARVAFVPPKGGVYKAIVTVRDAKGHTHQASAYVWISSNEYVAWRQTNDRTFTLIPDKEMYSPGDTAEILIAQPFEGQVHALVTYERGHIYKREVVLLEGNSTVYKLPVTEDMAPMAYVSVVVVSGADNTGTPDFKIGITRINVDTSRKTLDVKITVDKVSAGPGDEVTYTLLTKDQSGKPVSADVSLAVVDKAALALAPSNSSPMLDYFYPDQALGVGTALGIVLNAEDFNAQYRESIPEGGGSGGGGGENSLGIITVREDFKDTAFFEAQLMTDANGRAQVKVKLPENLTTWQAETRAVTSDSRVGQAVQDLVSTKPLFVQLQTPRFFVAGDQARVGAAVHNTSSGLLKVNVSLEAQGVDLISAASQVVDVAAKGQAYVTWDLKARDGAQRVDLIAHAVSSPYEDSSKPTLGTLPGQGIPVYTYTAVETVGTSGMLRSADSATEGFQLPSTFSYTGAQLSVEVSPSLAASMQDSLSFLEDYPYLCMEQTVSRFLPNVIASRALKAAGLPSPTLQENLDKQVNAALQRIYAKQNYDGGWNWWDGVESDPQTSAYVVYGLLEAKESGYTVSTSALTKGLNYLNENAPDLDRNDATWQYNRHVFMLYVLARAGELQAGRTNFAYEHRTSLSLYGKAYLAQAIYLLDHEDTRVASLMSDLATATVMSAAGAHWEESSQDYWNWNTDTRTTAIVLNAFVQIDPQNPIAADGVRWLMAHRESAHWRSTQETAWSLIALTSWLAASKEYETSYQFAIGLNGDLLQRGSATRDNLDEAVKLQVQLKDLLKDEVNYLVFTRGSGTGNLYYTAYLSATLPVESIQPLDQGMSLSRQYYTLDDPKTPITSIKRGEIVRVRLTIVASAAVHYAVVDDPLPAGLEAIDTSLATDTQVPSVYTLQDYTKRGWGWWFFDHIELRDEKVVLSANYLPAGTYVFTYLARAGTAGTFKVIPPTGMEFYFPDVGGRGAGSLFTVNP
jgi:uncharacterized protein YfaS (alpha-2-macroglobulin family)